MVGIKSTPLVGIGLTDFTNSGAHPANPLAASLIYFIGLGGLYRWREN